MCYSTLAHIEVMLLARIAFPHMHRSHVGAPKQGRAEVLMKAGGEQRGSQDPPVFLSPRLFWHSFGLAGIYNKYWGKKELCSCRGERAVWQVAGGDIYLIHLL